MAMKKILLATTDVRKFTSELIRLGKLGAVFTDECVAIKGLPLLRATVLIDESVDVGSSAILSVYGSVEVNEENNQVEKVKEENTNSQEKQTRKPRTTRTENKD